MEGTQGMDRQLFQHVCDVLDRAGFRMRDGGRGLMVVSTPQGVQVGWRPHHTPGSSADAVGRGAVGGGGGGGGGPGGYGQGIKAATAAALAAVLEQAGFCVLTQDADLLVTTSGDGWTSVPVPS